MATLNDMVLPIVQLLGNRGDVAALCAEAIGDTVIELSDNYPFEQLRETGPLVQFVIGQSAYTPEFFMKPGLIGGNAKIFNKVVSWFFYLQQPVNLAANPNIGNNNPGYNLIFRDMENLEVLYNTISLPQFWSQVGNETVYVAATPRSTYYTYMRYQYLHPLTAPVPLLADPLLLPTTWYDIIQYGSAERIALKLRMSDVADRFHQKLFGDPEFQRSSGGRGQPGLIARRTSQTQKNQARTTRSVRLIRSSY